MATRVFDTNPNPQLMVAGIPVPEQFTFRMFNAAQAATTVLGNAAGATIVAMNVAAGATIYIDSSSANDAVAGSGAQICRVWGFNTKGQLQYEDVSPVGTTGTALASTDFVTVFFMEVTQGAAAAGNIFIQDDAAGTTKYLCIQATAVQSSMTHFVLPTTVIGGFELQGYTTIAATATDSLYVTQREYVLAAVTATVQYAAPQTVSVAANNTLFIKTAGFLRPGHHSDFYMDDIGTTAQTLNWGLTVGLRYL